MSKVALWIKGHDQRIFYFINRRTQRMLLNFTMNAVTHLGGATATILATLALILLGTTTELKVTATQALVALAVSHIPAAIAKKAYPRKRPYMVLKDTYIGKFPLSDHSFPSGHTTAVFSTVTPFVIAYPLLALILAPLALTVGISRIYLGQHYPTDVIAGMVLGTVTGLLVSAQVHFNPIDWLT
jgi:undecaprenyl-diphosphatase